MVENSSAATSSSTSFTWCLDPQSSGVYFVSVSDSFGDGVMDGSINHCRCF